MPILRISNLPCVFTQPAGERPAGTLEKSAANGSFGVTRTRALPTTSSSLATTVPICTGALSSAVYLPSLIVPFKAGGTGGGGSPSFGGGGGGNPSGRGAASRLQSLISTSSLIKCPSASKPLTLNVIDFPGSTDTSAGTTCR